MELYNDITVPRRSARVELAVKKSDKTLDEIEKTQLMLRESIEETKRLAEKSDKLLKRHRHEMKVETN